LFADYSVSGGQIGAYGPGGAANVGVPAQSRGARLVTAVMCEGTGGRIGVELGDSYGDATLELYDAFGRCLARRNAVRGNESVWFDCRLSNGVYFVRASDSKRRESRKALVLR